MVAMVVIGGVGLLIAGLALGWIVRGPARWCPRDGEPLRCLMCSPVVYPTGRASVPMHNRPSAVTGGAPLMTRGQQSRTSSIPRRRS